MCYTTGMAHSTNPVTPQFVGYIRVSTDQQNQSGLGQEAQRAAIDAHVQRTGGRLLDVFSEVESGRKNARPELQRALATAAKHGATLLIARFDRLGRNVAFLSKLMDSDVPFVAIDVPGATRLTLHVLAAVAENEARAVSERTKAALQAAKARGVKLGNAGRYLTAEISKKGARAMAQKARDRYPIIGPLVLAWRREGRSYQTIAADLNKMRMELAITWTPMQVKRVERYASTPLDDTAA